MLVHVFTFYPSDQLRSHRQCTDENDTSDFEELIVIESFVVLSVNVFLGSRRLSIVLADDVKSDVHLSVDNKRDRFSTVHASSSRACSLKPIGTGSNYSTRRATSKKNKNKKKMPCRV
jgi:hypothetical protein